LYKQELHKAESDLMAIVSIATGMDDVLAVLMKERVA
jgi:hypothetical protein